MSLVNKLVSIPLEQGGVFRHKLGQVVTLADFVSIPLEQGGVFRQREFLTGIKEREVSIPLEQGGVFRQIVMRLFKKN